MKYAAVLILAGILLVACQAPIQQPTTRSAVTQPSTLPAGSATTRAAAITGTAAYWYTLPSKYSATSLDFQKLVDACVQTADDYQFPIDYINYRSGLVATRPVVSQQFIEFWRDDTTTSYELLQSSLQTIRRTLRFDIDRTHEGIYVVHPKVLVERLALTPQRITSIGEYRYIFTNAGSPLVTSSQPPTLANHHWYAIGRDPDLESLLADDIHDQLRQR